MNIHCYVLIAVLIITPTYALVYRWSKLSPSDEVDKSNEKWLSIAGVSAELKTKFNSFVPDIWKIFKINFKREYSNLKEELWRFRVFSKHILLMYMHNSLYYIGMVTYELGVNDFSDKTAAELKHLTCFRLNLNHTRSGSTYLSLSSVALPSSIDWRSKGAVTRVKDQGQCGSCYAFSATGSLEGQHHRKTAKLIGLSEQQIVDCSSQFGNNGCFGGIMDNVFKYVKENGGIQSEVDYPYSSGESGDSKPCAFKEKLVKAHVTGHVDIPSGNIHALKEAVALNGPISIAINADLPSFQMYKRGVYSDPECYGTVEYLDHGVLLVGYGEHNGTPYWLVKNSWGPRWGEDGYIKILRDGNNTCGVATMASFPLV